MAISDRGRRRLVTAAVALHGVLVVWLAVFLLAIIPRARPAFPSSGPDQVIALFMLILGVSGFALVGWLLSRRQPRQPLVPLLVLPSLAMVVQLAQVSWAMLADRYDWPGLSVVLWTSTWLWLVIPAALVMLLIRFPTGRPLSVGWQGYERLVLGHFGILTVWYAFSPDAQGTPVQQPNPLGIEWLRPLQPAGDIALTLAGAHLFGGLLALAIRYRRGDDVERQQLRWFAAAGVVYLLTVGARTFLGAPWVIEAAAIAALAAAIGVAVLRYRLWDLGLVLRRTITYAVLTALLVAGYVGLVLALRAVLPVGLWPELLVTAVVAIVALPLRELLQRGLDRILFGQRRDPYAVVRALGQRLEDGAEPTLLSVVRELATSLRLPGVAVRLPDGTVAAAHGEPAADGVRIPLDHQGDRVGELIASRRHPAEPLTGHDLRLLTDLTGHLGVTVRSAVLDEAVRRSQERLATAREAERARLRRDLHDEMGPLLGAASLRVQAARNLLTQPDPPAARIATVLGSIASDLERALQEVQRILADLRPTTLAEHGLLAALRQHADSWAGTLQIRLDLPDQLPALDPAVEAAAYRIAIEGLHNADRHSGGTTVTLRIRADNGELQVEVTDDGHGLAQPTKTGLGLGSMRERARLAGGTLRLEPVESGGLRVRGRLPVVPA